MTILQNRTFGYGVSATFDMSELYVGDNELNPRLNSLKKGENNEDMRPLRHICDTI
jgi:hypothetical protein